MGHTILEVNGKKYDARTGQLIGPENSQHVDVAPARSAHSIDGMTAKVHPAHLKPLTPAHLTTKNHSVPIKPRQKFVHDITVNKRHQLQKSQTLMRKTVAKPVAKVAQAHNVTNTPKPTQSLTVQTHPLVTRFQPRTEHDITPRIEHLAVAKEHIPLAPTPKETSVTQQQGSLSAESFVSQQLSKAIESQDQQKKVKKNRFGFLRSRKALSLSAGVLSVVVIAVFIAIQNMPTITLAMASRRSGLSINMPDGIPSNFALNKEVIYNESEITFSYASRTDEREFTISTQTTEDLTAQSLEKAISLNTKGNYQTYQAGGITLFITGPGRADWIDGGQRFSLSGNSGLSSEQLATIASSL